MILIVGGAGYIGSHVNKELTKRGYKTVVFDRLSTGHKEFVKWGELVVGDLSNKEDIRAVFKKYPIEAVFNFAALIEAGDSVVDPEKFYYNNTVNNLNLLSVMREFRVNKIIFSSTAAVYGIPSYTPIDEKHPQAPINPYGWTKFFNEQIFRSFGEAYGLKYVVFRYFNAAGADPETEIGEWHQPESHLIPIVFDAVVGKREMVKINGTDYDTPDGTCVRDYIHVSDLANAHVLGLKWLLDGKESEFFNLGNGKGFSVREVIETTKKVTGKDFKVVESERRPGDPPLLIADSRKAKEILGWSPKYADISVIIDTAWKWNQKLGK